MGRRGEGGRREEDEKIGEGGRAGGREGGRERGREGGREGERERGRAHVKELPTLVCVGLSLCKVLSLQMILGQEKVGMALLLRNVHLEGRQSRVSCQPPHISLATTICCHDNHCVLPWQTCRHGNYISLGGRLLDIGHDDYRTYSSGL